MTHHAGENCANGAAGGRAMQLLQAVSSSETSLCTIVAKSSASLILSKCPGPVQRIILQYVPTDLLCASLWSRFRDQENWKSFTPDDRDAAVTAGGQAPGKPCRAFEPG